MLVVKHLTSTYCELYQIHLNILYNHSSSTLKSCRFPFCQVEDLITLISLCFYFNDRPQHENLQLVQNTAASVLSGIKQSECTQSDLHSLTIQTKSDINPFIFVCSLHTFRSQDAYFLSVRGSPGFL